MLRKTVKRSQGSLLNTKIRTKIAYYRPWHFSFVFNGLVSKTKEKSFKFGLEKVY